MEIEVKHEMTGFNDTAEAYNAKLWEISKALCAAPMSASTPTCRQTLSQADCVQEYHCLCTCGPPAWDPRTGGPRSSLRPRLLLHCVI